LALIIRIYHDAPSSECQTQEVTLTTPIYIGKQIEKCFLRFSFELLPSRLLSEYLHTKTYARFSVLYGSEIRPFIKKNKITN